jgi:hypothetical protein
MRTPRHVIPRRPGEATPLLARRALLAVTLAVAATPLWAQEAGEGGEGGEGVATAGAVPAVALLTALGLVEGHLRAGAWLYAEGRGDLAVTHMKHPGDEIYTGLEPMLAAAGAPGFAGELNALAQAVEGGRPAAEVEPAQAAALAAIDVARDAAQASPYAQARSIEALLRVAAEEYGIGIVNGQVANLHEYQDAWGFTQVAADQAKALSELAPEAGVAMVEAIAATAPIFPSLVPEGTVAGDATALLGAAARVELAGLALK